MRNGLLGALGVSLLSFLPALAEGPSLRTQAVIRAEQPAEPGVKAPDPPAAKAKASELQAPPVSSLSWALDEGAAGPRLWMTADYLLWWLRDMPLPVPLMTTGSAAEVPPGGIGQPNTLVVFGHTDLDYHSFSGLRIGAGAWLNAGQTVGIEGSYFLLERRSVAFATASDATGFPVIARPIINAVSGLNNVEVDAFPGNIAGGGSIIAEVRLQGWEINAVATALRSDTVRFDVLGGFRALDLNENLTITDVLLPLNVGSFTFLGAPVSPPSIVTDFDRFGTVNKFYGVQLGGRAEWQSNRWTLGVLGKLALGTNQQLVKIDGNSTLLVPGGGTFTVPGGVLAQLSNIGRHFNEELAVIPEIGIHVGVQLRPGIQATFGYTFLYWNQVVRPGDQIDLTVNRFLVPTDQLFGTGAGPARPALAEFRQSDFWAHGIQFGLEFQY